LLKLLLFDIDGTLIHSGGAGKRAMNAAFEEIFGVSNALDRIPVAGCTDLAIVDSAIQEFGLRRNHGRLELFKERYFKYIQIEIEKISPEMQILPGVRDLLDELRKRSNTYLGLLTGNWEFSARVKLAHCGLSDYFGIGAFADDSMVRQELVPVAIERFEKKLGKSQRKENVYIIGDTFADIDCAHAHAAKAVAVATGPFSVQELREHGADYVFEDFSATDEVLKVLG